MVLSYAVCNVNVMPIRSEAQHSAEQVSQALLGERVAVISTTANGWAHIICEWDHYEGWCKASQLHFIAHKENKKQSKYLSAAFQDRLYNDSFHIPLSPGSDLSFVKKTFSPEKLKFKGKKLEIAALSTSRQNIQHFSRQFLYTPYLWGGRSIWGIDCSGFSQIVYKLCGISIARDASQQALEGEVVDFLQNVQCGDLAFFDNEEGHITHVGILLDSQNIIHATDSSGCVVIDAIDHAGIISRRLRKRTHKLRVIKRFF